MGRAERRVAEALLLDLGWPNPEARIVVFLWAVVLRRWRRFMHWVEDPA